MSMRILGHGMKLGVVQSIKGALESAERYSLVRPHANCDFHVVGQGYTWDTQDRNADMKTRCHWLGRGGADDARLVLRHGDPGRTEYRAAL